MAQRRPLQKLPTASATQERARNNLFRKLGEKGLCRRLRRRIRGCLGWLDERPCSRKKCLGRPCIAGPLTRWARRRRLDPEIQSSGLGRVARCALRVWPARALPGRLESRGQRGCAHWPSSAPPTDRSCRQRGIHRRSATWRPPATRSGPRAPLSKWMGLNEGDQAQRLKC